MRVLRRTGSACAGAFLLGIAVLGVTTGHAAASPSLTLGTTAGVPGHGGIGYDGVLATQTQLDVPRALATDAYGDVFVADSAAHVVREITPDGYAHVVAGVPGIGGSDVGGVAGTRAHLQSPSGLLVVPGGLLIADPGAHRVVLLQDGAVSAFAGDGTSGPPVEGQAARTSRFRAPTGLAYDGAGSVYVSDTGDQTVWRISPQGALSRVAGVSHSAGYDGNGLAARSSRLSGPTGLAWVSGHLDVADTGNGRIRSVSSSGYLGQVTAEPGAQPTGLLAGSGGQLYVADAAGVVGVVVGGEVSPYAGRLGTVATSADGTAASAATLNVPVAVAFAGNGRLLVAESGSAAVRDLRAGGTAPQQPAAPVGTPSNNAITVTWKSVNDGGSAVLDWSVRAYAGSTVLGPIVVPGGTYSTTLQGLANDQPYYLTITARNAYGSSTASMYSDPVVPHAPPNLTNVSGGGRPGGSNGGGLPTSGPTSGPTAPGTTGPTAGPTSAPTASASSPTQYLTLPQPGQVVQRLQPVPQPTGMPSDASEPSPRTLLTPTAPQTGQTAAPLVTNTPTPTGSVEAAPFVPVRSFADAATDVAVVGKKTAVPLVLVGLLGAFLVLQGLVDRRDPKLAQAPVHAERGLEFGPA